MAVFQLGVSCRLACDKIDHIDDQQYLAPTASWRLGGGVVGLGAGGPEQVLVKVSDVSPCPPTHQDPSSRARKSHTHVLKRARRFAIKRPVRAYISRALALGHSISFAQVKQSLVERIKPACVSRLCFPAKLSDCRIESISASAKRTGGFVTPRGDKNGELLVKGV